MKFRSQRIRVAETKQNLRKDDSSVGSFPSSRSRTADFRQALTIPSDIRIVTRRESQTERCAFLRYVRSRCLRSLCTRYALTQNTCLPSINEADDDEDVAAAVSAASAA